ncbi:hypothetical protein EVAR_15937_1 [Eumeta japonica]|uniref:Uncharacterized protein n=1 Tax=Eumeta variegata TaxID=151549 RepID=A0A4C1UMQ8_EUMVA|nr:hypothetical protein EVAR_15937_1 [Eumeta japonica]
MDEDYNDPQDVLNEGGNRIAGDGADGCEIQKAEFQVRNMAEICDNLYPLKSKLISLDGDLKLKSSFEDQQWTLACSMQPTAEE